MVFHACRSFVGEEITGRCLEEIQHRRFFPRGRVRYVNDRRCTVERFRESFAGESVNAGVGRCGDRFVPVLAKLVTSFDPMSPVPPMTTIFMTASLDCWSLHVLRFRAPRLTLMRSSPRCESCERKRKQREQRGDCANSSASHQDVACPESRALHLIKRAY